MQAIEQVAEHRLPSAGRSTFPGSLEEIIRASTIAAISFFAISLVQFWRVSPIVRSRNLSRIEASLVIPQENLSLTQVKSLVHCALTLGIDERQITEAYSVSMKRYTKQVQDSDRAVLRIR